MNASPREASALAETNTGVDRPLWEEYHESRRCSRDTYPESYITKYTHAKRTTSCPAGRYPAVSWKITERVRSRS